jgi:hypothetical protein
VDRPLTLEDLLKAPAFGDFAERRLEMRYSCSLPGTVAWDGHSVPCEILSLSRGGVSARCEGVLVKGGNVEVRIENAPAPLTCRVVWAGPGPGLVCRLFVLDSPEAAQQSWLESQLRELGARARARRQRRSTVRVKCEIPAQLSWSEWVLAEPSWRERDAVLCDLGTSGARVECRGEPLPDEPLQLLFGPLESLPSLKIEASVIGARDGGTAHYGLVFPKVSASQRRHLLDYMNLVYNPRRT